jgi:lipopolysaccharide transport system ATP-binding protein
MPNDVIITAENVSKKFCLSLKRTLAYGIKDVARDMVGLNSTSSELRRDEFWALRDVSFEVKRGECLGLIGANGAGKSTLLKLINGIILPDTGTIRVHGRVGGLLELGAGFHPMLTGRENVCLSGAILGLSRDEIEAKFDGIVEFAGLEEFVDSPVKYYSSGMYVRLGFAVAISSAPDVLLIDESLAVGDTAFRKRCVDRVNDLIKRGMTIIVVAHNLQEIERITRRVLLLDHGDIRADGVPEEVIGSYMGLLSHYERHKARKVRDDKRKQFEPVIQIVEALICDGNGKEKCYFRTHEEVQIHINFIAYQPVLNPVFRVQIYRQDGVFCHGMNTERNRLNLGAVSGEGNIVLKYISLSLLSGNYSVRVAVMLSQYDEFPLHELIASQGIHMESRMADGGGVCAIPAEWLPPETG